MAASLFIVVLTGVSLLIALYRIAIYFLTRHFTKEFAKRKLKFVRVPSQIWSVITKKRFEYLEQKLLNENNKLYGCCNFLNKTITTIEPELVQIVFNKEFTNFTNRRVCCS